MSSERLEPSNESTETTAANERSLCMDAGQSGIKRAVRTRSARFDLTPFRGIRNDLPVVPQIAEAARDAMQLLPTSDKALRPSVLCVGTTGLDEGDSAGSLIDLVEPAGLRVVYLSHDSVTGFLGAVGRRHGAVVSAGTGVVTLGVGEAEVARVDGWGYLVGNAGAASWMGRRAVEAVLRAFDGRGPASALTQRVKAKYPNLEKAYLELYADERRVEHLAALAKDVADLADTDAVAAEISVAAARELAISAHDALRRVGLASAPEAVVCGRGGVFDSVHLAKHFGMYVRSLCPSASLVGAGGDGVDGAFLLRAVSDRPPLGRMILRAEAVGAVGSSAA